MAFKEIAGQGQIRKLEIRKPVTGFLLDYAPSHDADSSGKILLQTESGETFSLWSGYDLDTKLCVMGAPDKKGKVRGESLKPGMAGRLVRVTWLETRKIKGGRKVNNFRVEIDETKKLKGLPGLK